MHRLRIHRALGILAIVLALVAAACGDDDATDETTASTAAPVTTATSPPATTASTEAPATTEAPGSGNRQLDGVAAAITVDGDVSDWDGIAGLEMTLVGIEGEDVDDVVADVKVAHDGEFLYMLFAVSDDYDFNIDDHKFSPAIGVMWAIESGAGSAMGATEEDQDTSLGLVDIWHWELDCDFGAEQGGRVGGPGEGKPLGNDDACNFDDEYSTDPETREDDGNDGEAGAENSLLGVWMHTNPVADGEGTWYFEMSRPLQTGDAQDAQFTVGGTVLLAMAYWDPDNSVEGWDDATHAVSSIDGWIDVNLLAGDVDVSAMRTLDAPMAAITVDLDISDWDGIAGLDMTLVGIEGEDVDDQAANVKVAHDGEFLYMLFSVSDDYDFNIDDHKLSPAIGVMWAITSGAGSAMGATEDDQDTSLGLVDIWHWELDCDFGAEQGGRVGGPGEGKPLGNDDACNFDDEYSTDPETREDDGNDGEAGAENSLLGVWMHTNPVADGEGTWYFEMSRPLQTGDAQDAQFTVGGTVLLAMAYWDPDNSVEGWDDATHAVSSIDGWIQVTLQRN